MKKITTVLFDFDGVIVNTEPQYDLFADILVKKYGCVENLGELSRGTTFTHMLDTFFSDCTEQQIKDIWHEAEKFELQMDYPLLEGVVDFIHHLKGNGYKVGLVTSSQDRKMEVALPKLRLVDAFDTKVTSDRVTVGKPAPDCYLLAAEDLNVSPQECLVFEDSLHGIQAATSAQMRVVGVSTSVTTEELREKSHGVIADFTDLAYLSDLLK